MRLSLAILSTVAPGKRWVSFHSVSPVFTVYMLHVAAGMTHRQKAPRHGHTPCFADYECEAGMHAHLVALHTLFSMTASCTMPSSTCCCCCNACMHACMHACITVVLSLFAVKSVMIMQAQ
jgi:hypothetical protein